MLIVTFAIVVAAPLAVVPSSSTRPPAGLKACATPDLVNPDPARYNDAVPHAALASELERALSAPGDQIAPAALVVARLEHPHLDGRPYLDQLDDFGRQGARRLEGIDSRRARVAALNRYVFGSLGFGANREQYLDPRNNFLNVVMDRRIGIPITLSILYVEIGRRAGLPLEGIGFPGHFLVRCDGDEPGDEHAIVIDPFNSGSILSEFECISLLREHAGEEATWDPALLRPATRRAIAVRLLTNLKRAYVALRSFSHARRAADLLIALDSTAITELRDRGLLSYHLEDFPAALRDLEKYLSLMPNAKLDRVNGQPATSQPEAEEDADGPREEGQAIWEHVKNIRRRVAGLN